MLYLMAVLTFLAGILFYTLSPREDRLDMDVFQGEPFIQSFLSQHQAAKDYLRRWYGINKPQGEVFNLRPELVNYLSGGLDHEMCGDEDYPDTFNQAGDPLGDSTAPCFVSRVVCTTINGAAPQNCASSDPNDPEPTIYVVTYGGLTKEGHRPAWWPKGSTSRVRQYERWRRAFASRTTGSTSCGTIFKKERLDGRSQYCLDIGAATFKKDSSCAKVIPNGVLSGLFEGGEPTSDMFFCMSKVKQGPFPYYPASLQRFWDGLDNQNKHAPNSSKSTRLSGAEGKWLDLVSSQPAGQYTQETPGVFIFKNLTSSYFEDVPAIVLNGKSAMVDFDMNSSILQNDFTLTILFGFNKELPVATLFSFDDGRSEDSKTSFGLSIGGASEGEKNGVQLVLTFEKGGVKDPYSFTRTYLDYTVYENLVSTVTVRRQGDRISLYLGSYIQHDPAIDGVLSEDQKGILTTLGRLNNQKMKMTGGGNDDNQKVYVYGVRFFNRALTTGEIYDMYKEDAWRFPMYIATKYVGEPAPNP